MDEEGEKAKGKKKESRHSNDMRERKNDYELFEVSESQSMERK